MTAFVNRVDVKPGDVFFVPAGMIHAIGPGCLLLEAQSRLILPCSRSIGAANIC